MAAYLIAQIRITDPEGWAAYRAAVGPSAEKFGGRYVVRDASPQVIEGAAHDGRRLVIYEFPSLEAIHAFWQSPEYVAVKALRESAAELDVWAVPGV